MYESVIRLAFVVELRHWTISWYDPSAVGNTIICPFYVNLTNEGPDISLKVTLFPPLLFIVNLVY